MKNEDSIKSQYYAELIKELMSVEENCPEEDKMDPRLVELWKKKLEEKVDKAFLECVVTGREDFMLTKNEVQEAFEEAGLEYAGLVIDDLVDKELLEVSVDKKGTMLYGLTKKGKKILKDPLK